MPGLPLVKTGRAGYSDPVKRLPASMPASMPALLVPILVSLVALGGCGDDAAEVAEPGSGSASEEVTLGECEELLPGSVLDTLGWAGGTPSVDLGRCVLTIDDGSNISVVRRPTPGAAEGELEARCDDVGAEEVDWYAGAAGQCGTVGPDGTSTGVLLVLVDDATLVEARVDPRADTDPDRVQQGLVEIVSAYAAGG